MIKTLTTIALFFSTFSFGQLPDERIYKNIDGLTTVDSVLWNDIVGGFYVSDGFTGYNFRLDSNMTFTKINFGCVARSNVDSGSWTIENKNKIVLKSNAKTLSFDVLRFDDFYFFILPPQRQRFIDDLQPAKNNFKNAKPFKIDNRTYSANYPIGHCLKEKYFAKDIADY